MTEPVPKRLGARRVARESDLAMLRLALEEGRRLLDAQMSELDGIRQRLVQFLSFVGTATAFLVGAGLSTAHKDGAFSSVAIIGALLFMAALYLALSILRGTHPATPFRQPFDWTFRLNPSALVSYLSYDIGQPDEAKFLDALVAECQGYADENENHLSMVRIAYWAFLLLMSVQLALWVALVVLYR